MFNDIYYAEYYENIEYNKGNVDLKKSVVKEINHGDLDKMLHIINNIIINRGKRMVNDLCEYFKQD